MGKMRGFFAALRMTIHLLEDMTIQLSEDGDAFVYYEIVDADVEGFA